MRGLFTKSLHEVWLPTLVFGVALLAVMGLLTYILPQIQQGISEVLNRLPFVRPFLSALLGTELGDRLTARTMQAFLWVHPVVLTLLWAHDTALCTRLPAGEIDRGTVDVLLSLPVSRRAIYWCESSIWLASGLLILAMGFAGHRLASRVAPDAVHPEPVRALMVMANLYCLYIAVGGFAFLVSALSDHRGRAMAVVFGVVLASFLLNFVAQFWEPASTVAFLGVLEYYQPAAILQHGEFPWRNVAVLLSIGACAWLLGGEVLARRSICTL